MAKAREVEEEDEDEEEHEDGGAIYVVAKDGDDAKGGAIHVRGDLIVTGNLSIHNSSANHGGSLGLKYLWSKV